MSDVTPEKADVPAFPYPGARGLLTAGKVAEPVPTSAGVIAQTMAVMADAATVLLFGSDEQRRAVESHMRANRRSQ